MLKRSQCARNQAAPAATTSWKKTRKTRITREYLRSCRRHGHYLANRRSGVQHVEPMKRRMHEHRKTRLAEMTRDGQPLLRPHIGAGERLLQIDLAAASRDARYAFGVDCFHDALPCPARLERLRLHEAIVLVIGVPAVGTRNRDGQSPNARELRVQQFRMAAPCGEPGGQFLQLLSSDRGLHFSHPPVRSERLVEPAEAG